MTVRRISDRGGLMGFVASPYNLINMAFVAEEKCRGDRHNERVGADGRELNPFH